MISCSYHYFEKNVYILLNSTLPFHRHKLNYTYSLSKTDIRSKPYGDFNFTHLTSLDDQAIRSNKKPSYWLITIPPVPLKRQYCCFDAKKTEKTSDKTESGKHSKHC